MGRITKQGRRDLRYAMIQAAHNAVEHPKWRRELESGLRLIDKSYNG